MSDPTRAELLLAAAIEVIASYRFCASQDAADYVADTLRGMQANPVRYDLILYERARALLGSEWKPIDDKAKHAGRILAWCDKSGALTVTWDDLCNGWIGDPNEASEYEPEFFKPTHYMPLPFPPSSGASDV